MKLKEFQGIVELTEFSSQHKQENKAIRKEQNNSYHPQLKASFNLNGDVSSDEECMQFFIQEILFGSSYVICIFIS